VPPTRLHRRVDQHLDEEIALRVAAAHRLISVPPSNTTPQSAKPIEV
jgi:hypothetical protein